MAQYPAGMYDGSLGLGTFPTGGVSATNPHVTTTNTPDSSTIEKKEWEKRGAQVLNEAFSAQARKGAPIANGVLWYFPAALLEVARVSLAGNNQHNPGQPLHHSRGKSMDHADALVRHLLEAGKIDSDGIRHTAKVAWRALALLQEELEQDLDLPLPRNARYTDHEGTD